MWDPCCTETLRGTAFGAYEWTVEGLDTWSGTLRAVITDGLAAGTFVGQGVQGTTQRGTFTETEPGVSALEGVILAPPGRTR